MISVSWNRLMQEQKDTARTRCGGRSFVEVSLPRVRAGFCAVCSQIPSTTTVISQQVQKEYGCTNAFRDCALNDYARTQPVQTG